MPDLLLDELPTRWRGREIIPDFRPMVWLVNAYVRGQADEDPTGFAIDALCAVRSLPASLAAFTISC